MCFQGCPIVLLNLCGDPNQYVQYFHKFPFDSEMYRSRVYFHLISDHLLDLTPEEELEKYKTYQMAQRAYRGKDQGKPNKKDRRDIDHFLEGW